jgi:hypothetical protein
MNLYKFRKIREINKKYKKVKLYNSLKLINLDQDFNKVS